MISESAQAFNVSSPLQPFNRADPIFVRLTRPSLPGHQRPGPHAHREGERDAAGLGGLRLPQAVADEDCGAGRGETKVVKPPFTYRLGKSQLFVTRLLPLLTDKTANFLNFSQMHLAPYHIYCDYIRPKAYRS